MSVMWYNFVYVGIICFKKIVLLFKCLIVWVIDFGNCYKVMRDVMYLYINRKFCNCVSKCGI